MNHKYKAAGAEAQFQPGSRGRVLRNSLGIVRVSDMNRAEFQALELAQEAAIELYGPENRFTPAADSEIARLLAQVHAEVVLIHPFRDGNGRVARRHAPLTAIFERVIMHSRKSAVSRRSRIP